MMYVKLKEPDRQNIESFVTLNEESFLERSMRALSRYAGYTVLVMCLMLIFLIFTTLT